MTARLQIEALTVRFGDRAVVDGFDLCVKRGEVVAVLGPSGSGKSTILRAVAGLQAPTSGSVALDGIDAAGTPPHRRGVGLMFQDHALFPHLDVRANVAFGLKVAGVARPEREARADELLELVDLGDLGARSVASLSGGEQQRVALARSLASEPRLLLLDEPFGALDRPLRDRLLGHLRALIDRLELTVVAVTHDHSEAFALADRIVLLDEGRLVQEGSPREVWRRPARRRAAELLALPNLFDVLVVGGAAELPWGPVALTAADGPASVLVPEGAVRVARDGPIASVLESAAFRGPGTHAVVRLATGDRLSALTLEELPRVGEEVRLLVDDSSIVVLSR